METEQPGAIFMDHALAIDMRPAQTSGTGGWTAYCEAARTQLSPAERAAASKPLFKEEKGDGRRCR